MWLSNVLPRHKVNEVLVHLKTLVNLKIVMLSYRNTTKVHTAWFYLYKILENGNLSIVTESRSVVAWGGRLGRSRKKGLQRVEENFGGWWLYLLSLFCWWFHRRRPMEEIIKLFTLCAAHCGSIIPPYNCKTHTHVLRRRELNIKFTWPS